MSALQKESAKEDPKLKVQRPPHIEIKERQTQELILGFAGAVGSGSTTVIDLVKDILSDQAYTCHHIKISEYIEACRDDKIIEVGIDESIKSSDSKFYRYRSLQKAGNALRTASQDYILAEYAITKIASLRESESKKSGASPEKTAIDQRTAYLIDQLKHPAEVEFLRSLYGNAFYMIGVVSSQENRSARLLSVEGVKASNISELIECDRKESDGNGQQLEKTLHLSDFFVSTDRPQREVIRSHLERFLRLIHGDGAITPAADEFGMYIAYSSGLRSACLSRQVGASITDTDGNLIATGRNDVPAPGGGLYSPEHGEGDARCANWGTASCRNFDEKEKIREQFKNIAGKILDELNIFGEKQNDLFNKERNIQEILANSMFKETRVKDLIEFSRSIHAEMDAITSLARKSNASSVGSTLYSTTFPCHNCARHIVAAGISKVVYIEPYEKSLALDLHGDAITLDASGPARKAGIRKVYFSHFEGVAPRLYHELFESVTDRKGRDGRLIRLKIASSDQKIPEYLDPYTQLEAKVAEHWKTESLKLKGGTP